jgi:hypothetical protein
MAIYGKFMRKMMTNHWILRALFLYEPTWHGTAFHNSLSRSFLPSVSGKLWGWFIIDLTTSGSPRFDPNGDHQTPQSDDDLFLHVFTVC